MFTLYSNFIQTQAFAQNDDSIFPQWIRQQSTEIWVNGDITDAEYLALIENVLIITFFQLKLNLMKKSQTCCKNGVKDIPELSQEVDTESNSSMDKRSCSMVGRRKNHR